MLGQCSATQTYSQANFFLFCSARVWTQSLIYAMLGKCSTTELHSQPNNFLISSQAWFRALHTLMTAHWKKGHQTQALLRGRHRQLKQAWWRLGGLTPASVQLRMSFFELLMLSLVFHAFCLASHNCLSWWTSALLTSDKWPALQSAVWSNSVAAALATSVTLKWLIFYCVFPW